MAFLPRFAGEAEEVAAEEATLRAAATRDQRLTEAATAEMAELAQAESRFGGGWWRGLIGVSCFPPERGGFGAVWWGLASSMPGIT